MSVSAPLGPFVAVSGVTAENDRRVFLGGDDITIQTERALEALTRRVDDLNADIKDAAAVNVYLKHGGDFAAMNDVYRKYWPPDGPDGPPTRTTVVAGLRNPDALVEFAATIVPRGTEREVVHPAAWKPSPNPYSYGIRSGRTLFMSGLVPRSPRDHSLITGDIRIQTRALLENAKELLDAAGMKITDIINAKIYITDPASFDAMHSVYRQSFPVDPPACTVLVTTLMKPEFQVEMTLLAVQGKYRLTMPATPDHGGVQLSTFVQTEGRLFVSGMRGESPETRHNPTAQTQEILHRLSRILKRARFSWREVRELAVYVSDMGHASAVLYELAPFLPVMRRPAGVVVQTGLLTPGALVEISGTFARDRWRWR